MAIELSCVLAFSFSFHSVWPELILLPRSHVTPRPNQSLLQPSLSPTMPQSLIAKTRPRQRRINSSFGRFLPHSTGTRTRIPLGLMQSPGGHTGQTACRIL
ncbi:hypothetical protein BD309DRAFT_68063 [Dichomitus squalens]|uniref:Uncharacterized protein n=1 Tax=Dichomitus squalens TaxID=114155 RepID=A0A4V2K4D0_9APHY|nr:hypothetical protein BD311DRAFT_296785 [Dichomitus squalens]TBU43973.1 hypothetical protein BD309DRAFT_68063 [Dichomitus squalens]